MSGGKEAVINGLKLEDDIKNVMLSFNFKFMPYRDYQRLLKKEGNFLLKDIPYKTIYGQSGRSEFLIKSNLFNLNHRVECKEQKVPGSVDEKFPYLMRNCLESFPEKDVVIIHRGDGFKVGAVPWLKKEAEINKHIKNIYVFNLEEFVCFLNGKIK